MEREDGEMELDSIENGLSTAVASVTSRSVSSAPSVATPDIISTSIAPLTATPTIASSTAAPSIAPSTAAPSITPSTAEPSISNHASAAASTTTSTSARGNGVDKRPVKSAPPKKAVSSKRVAPSKKAASSTNPAQLKNLASSKNAIPAIAPAPKGSPNPSGALAPSEGAPRVPGLDSGKDKSVSNPSRRDEPGVDNDEDDHGGMSGGGGDEGGHNGNVAHGDEGGGDDAWFPPASPISGFHPMFDLPPSPILGLEDLPPSRFGSMEPATARAAPSTSPSVPIVATGLGQSTAPLSSVPTTVAGPNQPIPESPSMTHKRDQPDDSGTPEDVGPSTRAKRARKSSKVVPVAIPVAQKKAKKPAPTLRKSTTTMTTAPSPTTASDPPWLTSAISMLEAEELGGSWSSLVRAWLAFERKESQQASSILNSTNRPQIIRDWIQRARSVSYRPSIASTLDFERVYMSWWKELQPDWRMSSSGKIVYSKLDGDWGGMRTAGRNGLLSVVAALFFWGVALKKTQKTPYEDKGWKVGTDDCLRVLDSLLQE